VIIKEIPVTIQAIYRTSNGSIFPDLANMPVSVFRHGAGWPDKCLQGVAGTAFSTDLPAKSGKVFAMSRMRRNPELIEENSDAEHLENTV